MGTQMYLLGLPYCLQAQSRLSDWFAVLATNSHLQSVRSGRGNATDACTKPQQSIGMPGLAKTGGPAARLQFQVAGCIQ